MKFTIEKMPSFTLAYMRRVGEYGPANISLMNDFKLWANDYGLMDNESVILGISHDNPQVTEAGDCRYDVGIVIDESMEIDFEKDDSISLAIYGEGLYAVFVIHHTMEAVECAWLGVFDQMRSKGVELDFSRPAYERYRNLLVENHLCEICIPIKS